MALFRMLIMLVIVAGIAGVFLYFSPDSVKEKVLGYISGSPYIPAEVKSEAEKLYATPAMKREKLISELTQNLGNLQSYVEKTEPAGTASTSPEVALINRSKEIINEVLKQNADPTALKQITDALAAKVLSGNSCPTPAK